MLVTEWASLTPQAREEILKRPVRQINISDNVAAILAAVRAKGDAALLDFAKQFDCVTLDSLVVRQSKIKQAYQAVSDDLLNAIKTAISRIRAYQRACLPANKVVDTQDGVVVQRIARPIERVGLYVPGGSAPLISTLMMLAVPAEVAKCAQSIICTPCAKDGSVHAAILVAADLCGVTEIYKVGGAQAIAAMAYGTQTIPKVDKIFGPGNAWVTEAKKQVSQDMKGAAIDMPAGPSELLVIADENANPEFVAADLLSQAEHGPDSQVLLLSDSRSLLKAVEQVIQNQLPLLSRRTIAEQALQDSALILVDEIKTAIAISNRYAPEHLILQIEAPEQAIAHIQNAGAVFVGPWTPETMGDYMTGSNHVLPTYGAARAWSGLSVLDFMKWISVQSVSREGLMRLGPAAMRLAQAEGLDAHQYAVQIRLDAKKIGCVSELMRNDLKNFAPYSSARNEATQGRVWLNANESPWGEYNRYPEQQPVALIDAMARYYGVERKQILATRGSDEGIDLLVRLFCEPGEDSILISSPTFGMYAVCARLQGAKVLDVPLLKDSFELDQAAFLHAAKKAKLIFLCSPNNPTGNTVCESFLFTLCEQVQSTGLVVVDEAYIEFSDKASRVHAIQRYPNLIVLRTLSKAFALAAERVGALIACPDIVVALRKILSPYPLAASSVKAAVGALSDAQINIVQKNIKLITFEREAIQCALQKMEGVVKVWPSQANYILAQFEKDIYSFCLAQGVVLRDMSKRCGLNHCVRMTIGTSAENAHMIEVIEHATKEISFY